MSATGTTENEQATARRSIPDPACSRAGSARSLYARAAAHAAATVTATAPAAAASAATAASAIEAAVQRRARAIRVAAVVSVLAGLALLVPETLAHAQGGGGGGGGSIDPNRGANEIFGVIGLIGLLAGGIMAIGSLFARRVMAALGFALAGGIIWACCENPEGTMGAAAEWLINQFS